MANNKFWLHFPGRAKNDVVEGDSLEVNLYVWQFTRVRLHKTFRSPLFYDTSKLTQIKMGTLAGMRKPFDCKSHGYFCSTTILLEWALEALAGGAREDRAVALVMESRFDGLTYG